MKAPLPLMSKRAILALASAFTLLGAGAQPLLAQSPDDKLEEIEDRIDANEEKIEETREESQDIREQLEDAEDRRQDLAGRLEEVRSRLTDAREHLAEVQAELDAAQAQLDEWTAELEGARAELDARLAALNDRAAAAYRIGPTGYMEVVLGSKDLDALTDRLGYLEAVLEVDTEVVEEVRFARSVVAERQGQVEAYQGSVAERQAEVEERVLAIAEIEAEQSALLQQVDLEIDLQTDTLGDLQDARERYEDAVAQLQAESAQIQGLIEGVGSVGSGQLGGELAWPTAGPIVSGYGTRVHPVYGTPRFHAGVDIDGACGQPIVAAEGGTVLSSGENGGYGLATIVDHGDGLSTLYGHQSSLGVSSGQQVSRGQQIGLVGTTGLSTGCHLHFEVRINGSPVDPVPYLS